MAKLKQVGYTIKLNNGVDPQSFVDSVGVFTNSIGAVVAFMINCNNTYSTWEAAQVAGYSVVRVKKEEL